MTVDSVRDATTREAVLKALLDSIDAEYKKARAEVQAALDAQQKATGGTRFDAALPDGTKVGTITLTGGEPEAKVTDREAFIAWARAAYPTERETRVITREVQMVKTIRPAFEAHLLAQMTAAGVTRIVQAAQVDETTGEVTGDEVVHDVPGVAIKATRKRSHSVNFSKKDGQWVGRELIAEAYRNGQLTAIVLPALTPGAADKEAEA
ncbi:hypothetical protein [Streptomyces chryseus]